MGQLVTEVDALIGECVRAGVVFHPKAGQLRPELTQGRPPEALLERVKASREAILLRLAELMDFDTDESERLRLHARLRLADKTNEISEDEEEKC